MKRTITSILTIFLLSTLFANAASPTMIGRRGCGYAIENTAEAYREGARRGFKIMEAHVRLTSDSVFVTSHDGKTARLGGRMNVAKLRLTACGANDMPRNVTMAAMTVAPYVLSVNF